MLVKMYIYFFKKVSQKMYIFSIYSFLLNLFFTSWQLRFSTWSWRGVSAKLCRQTQRSARWGLSLMSSLNPLSYYPLYNFLCIFLRNGQTYLKNLAVFTPQNFLSLFGHFSIYCMKGLYFSKTRTLTSKKFLSL